MPTDDSSSLPDDSHVADAAPSRLADAAPSHLADSAIEDRRRRRILFRATHRGTHETDILIGGFVTARLAGFSAAELDELEEVMELDDVDLADWLTGRRPIPADAETPMLQRMRQSAEAAGAEMPLARRPR